MVQTGTVQGRNPTASFAAKQFACRGLRQIGTAACVPALAKLLPDPKLSHMARYALQGLACDEAAAALLAALNKVDGKLKVGMVTSLGERRDSKAVPALAKLLRDEALAGAAVRALGRIADPTAAKALAGASVGPELRSVWADAMLLGADSLHATGNDSDAASVYRKLFAKGNPTP